MGEEEGGEKKKKYSFHNDVFSLSLSPLPITHIFAK